MQKKVEGELNVNYFFSIVLVWVMITLSKQKPSNFFCPPSGTEKLHKFPQADKKFW